MIPACVLRLRVNRFVIQILFVFNRKSSFATVEIREYDWFIHLDSMRN